jgi:hypothetical protein
MTDSPLRYPTEIYAPFNEGDAARLRTYVRLVDDLVGSSFFEAAKDMSLTIGAEMEGPASEELTYPGEEAVRAVVAPFRQLYNHREPSSYDAVLNLLSDHVHDRESSRQAEAQEALRDLKKWKREALRFQGFAMNLNGWRPAPKDIIDLFFNGLYFHSDHKQAGILDGGMPDAFLRFEFLMTVQTLARVFAVGRNVVRLVLDETAVLPG